MHSKRPCEEPSAAAAPGEIGVLRDRPEVAKLANELMTTYCQVPQASEHRLPEVAAWWLERIVESELMYDALSGHEPDPLTLEAAEALLELEEAGVVPDHSVCGKCPAERVQNVGMCAQQLLQATGGLGRRKTG